MRFLEICESYCYYIFFGYCCSQKLCLLVLVSSPSGGYDFCCFAQVPVRHFCCWALFQFVLCLIPKTWVEVVSSLWTCQLKEASGLFDIFLLWLFQGFHRGLRFPCFMLTHERKVSVQRFCENFLELFPDERQDTISDNWLSELYVVLASKPEEWVMMLLFFLQMWIGYSLSIWIFRYCI